jgi:hypothetical protein
MIDLIGPYKYFAIALAVTLLLTVTYFTGRSHGLEKYYEFRTHVESKQKQAAAESERINAEVAAGWAAGLAWHRNNPRLVRVRDSCSVPVSASAGGLDERTATQGLSAKADVIFTARECEARLNDGIVDAAQLMALQDWVRKQSEIK